MRRIILNKKISVDCIKLIIIVIIKCRKTNIVNIKNNLCFANVEVFY